MAAAILTLLAREIRDWGNNHPHGFSAEPVVLPDGTVNLMVWRCTIPGKPTTDWEGGYFPLTLHFSEDYPRELPKCIFPQGFFHPNVFPSGTVCLSSDEGPPPATIQFSIKVENILVGIQYLLDQPNPAEPAQFVTQDAVEYKKRVQLQAMQYPALV